MKTSIFFLLRPTILVRYLRHGLLSSPVLLILALLLPGCTMPKNTTQISGFVKDGETSISGASVLFVGANMEDPDDDREVITNNQGFYRFEDLDPGAYFVSIAVVLGGGEKCVVFAPAILEVGTSLEVNFALPQQLELNNGVGNDANGNLVRCENN